VDYTKLSIEVKNLINQKEMIIKLLLKIVREESLI